MSSQVKSSNSPLRFINPSARNAKHPWDIQTQIVAGAYLMLGLALIAWSVTVARYAIGIPDGTDVFFAATCLSGVSLTAGVICTISSISYAILARREEEAYMKAHKLKI